MKKLTSTLLVFLLACASLAIAKGPSFGNQQLFNEGWQFILLKDTTGISAHAYATLPDTAAKWRTLDLPHDWSIEGQASPTLASCQGYLPTGVAWYKKNFTYDKVQGISGLLPSNNGDNQYIYFEGVYNRSKVYLNGHLLGERPNGYVSFMYDMTPYLKEGENELAVFVDHSRFADSRWYTGSGIYRDVYAVSAPYSHFKQWGISYTTPTISEKQATVEVKAEVVNAEAGQKIDVTIYDGDNNKVASGSVKKAKEENVLKLTIKKPILWSVDNPYLYTMTVELKDVKGQTIDSDIETVGIRSIEFDPNTGFYLNGKNMKIKGVCLHHDAGALGAVVPRDVWKRRLENLKKIGANAIRMSHNPQAPVLYDLCDELGFLVMDEVSDEWEFPKRKWIEGWNQGTPGFDGSWDFFEEWIEKDVSDMVLRDRNHPCIIMWSIGNEVDYPNDPYSHPVLDGSEINQPMFGGYDPEAPSAERIGLIAKRLVKRVKAIDTSRPTTGAMAGVVMSNETEYPDAIDLCGYNYTENRYAEDHATYPNRVIYGSETGIGYDQWLAVKNNDYICGQFIWTGTDYLGESGRWPSRGLNTGLLNFSSLPKPRGQFRASLWLETPFTYVGAYPQTTRRVQHRPGAKPWLSPDAPAIWNYDEGQPMRVVCYTNSPYAKLMLNGKEVGEKKPYDESTGIIFWDIPYHPGTLTAIGIDEEGNAQSESTITTSERPYALRARIDGDYTIEPKGVNHIIVEVVDENGNLVTLADNNVFCRVEGNARLLALEGNDNTDMGNYKDFQQRAHGGYLLAYIENGKEQGPVTITFSSPLLVPTSIEFNTAE